MVKSKKKLIFYIIGSIVSAICIIVSIFGMIKTSNDISHASRLAKTLDYYCIATVDSSFVIRTPDTRSHEGDFYSFIRVSYTVDGVEYSNIDAGVAKWHLSEGDEQLIYYNPSNPADCVASVSGYEIYSQFYAYIFAVGIVIISIMILPPIALKIKSRQRAKYEQKFPPPPQNNDNFYYNGYDDNYHMKM